MRQDDPLLMAVTVQTSSWTAGRASCRSCSAGSDADFMSAALAKNHQLTAEPTMLTGGGTAQARSGARPTQATDLAV
jgi:hypothetical protein